MGPTHRRSLRLAPLAAALLATTVAGAGGQEGAEIVLLDSSVIHGEPAALIRLQEPQERDARAADESATLDEVLQIRWRPTQRCVITSGPQTECVSLGEDLDTSLPTDWADASNALHWLPAQAPRVFHQWRHLPGSQWVWTAASWFSPDHRERALFRHTFEIPEGLRVVEATLLLGVDDALTAGRINGVDLPIPAGRAGVLRWDVTHAIRPGANLLALVALDNSSRSSPAESSLLNAAGLAYRLEVRGVPDAGPPERLPTCVAHLINGDRIGGALRLIDDSRVGLATAFGNISIDRDWVREILVASQPAPTGLPPAAREASGLAPIVFALPRALPPWTPGLLLNDGTHLSGRVLRTERRGVVVKPRYSDAWLVNSDEIQTIFVNGPSEEGHFRYPSENGPRLCRLTTLAGDRLSGLLERLSTDQVELNVPEAPPLRIPTAQVVECTFPMGSRLWAKRLIERSGAADERQILVWGHCGDTERELSYEENLAAQIQQVALDLGFPVQWIDDVRLASGSPDPAETPVLMIVDDSEEFPLTVNRPGDGLDSLLNYARSGGALVLIPAGTPFYHAREWTGQSWTIRPLRGSVPATLGFNYLTPGDWRPDARAFELPENRGETLLFERVAHAAPWDLLPQRLVFPPLEDARFRPILPVEGDTSLTFTPIYRLVSDSGESFGVAMALIRHGEGDLSRARIYHIAPALARAVDDLGEPALHRLLPTVLADALHSPPTVAGSSVAE